MEAPPLVIKRPQPASALRGILAVALVITPVVALIVMAIGRRTVHFDHPVVNIGAHLLILAFPLSWARTYFGQRLDIVPNSETVLANRWIWVMVKSILRKTVRRFLLKPNVMQIACKSIKKQLQNIP